VSEDLNPTHGMSPTLGIRPQTLAVVGPIRSVEPSTRHSCVQQSIGGVRELDAEAVLVQPDVFALRYGSLVPRGRVQRRMPTLVDGVASVFGVERPAGPFLGSARDVARRVAARRGRVEVGTAAHAIAIRRPLAGQHPLRLRCPAVRWCRLGIEHDDVVRVTFLAQTRLMFDSPVGGGRTLLA
jgi:hypothetical protein